VPSPLTIPGVQVRTQFEPAPVLPGATGVLGVVGVAERGPIDPTPVGSFGEFLQTFGPGSRYTMPEVHTALSNGVFEVFVARLTPGRGLKAQLALAADAGEPVAIVQARGEGTWGNQIAVRVEQIKTTGGAVKYVNLETSIDGTVVDRLQNLVMDELSPNYFFDAINERSRVLVAFDPLFLTALPKPIARTPLADAGERAAFATLNSGATAVIRAQAKAAGRDGNQLAVQVIDGQAARLFNGPAGVASIEVRARAAGAPGTKTQVAITPAAGPPGAPGSPPTAAVSLVVTPAPATPPAAAAPARTIGPATTVAMLVTMSAGDPDIEVISRGDVLPDVQAQVPLDRRVDIAAFTESRDTRLHTGLATVADIAAIQDDPDVSFSVIGAATALPDADDGKPLSSGRDQGPALELIGPNSAEPMLELVPAPGVTAALAVSIVQAVSPPSPDPVVNVEVFADGDSVETFNGLRMDPDDPAYLPEVLLASSAFVRAHDLFSRQRTTSFPQALARPVKLAGAASPAAADYQEALDRLEGAEEVDLVIGSVANQLPDAQVRAVHQAVVAHCTKMADVARNRIGLGSVTAGESSSTAAAIDHANDVRSDHFILSAPARSEAALAGLLGRQDYFQSPTFKTIASLDAPPGAYTDVQLTQLINDDVCVVNERRRVGIIVVKGVLTSGRQINVQRTANKAVRDVKAIADKYIGLLNNEGARNALKQQITALLLQMERDGALVPSTDGKDPAFSVDVYSTQADFANGIVRVDIAVRPVRSIDFIYATILVKN
jgi:hypothetical protein